jgi:protein-L-isoaspartate(D-aspartate) O-methyltransferase
VADTMTYTLPVQHALDQVDEAHYTLQEDGSRLPQTTAPRTIATMLDLLRVEPGQHILEIGTGSGYSTALLSHLVGPGGTVTTVDIDPALTDRAARRLDADGRTNVTALTGDGTQTSPATDADRVVAWATADRIPSAWIRRAALGALVVAPVQVTGAVKTTVVVRARHEHDGTLSTDLLLNSAFVEAADVPLDQWIVPPHGADVLAHDGDGKPYWLSAPWMRTASGGDSVLRHLIDAPREEDGPLHSGESGEDFRAFLLALAPAELTTGALGDPAWRIGASTTTGIALITPGDANSHVAAGDAGGSALLAQWAQRWRNLGSPGLDRMRPTLSPVGNGWRVQITLR